MSVTFRVDERVLAAVDARAVVERRSRSDVIRLAVEAWAGSEPVAPAPIVEGLRQQIAAVTATPVRQPLTSSSPAGWDVPATDPLDEIA